MENIKDIDLAYTAGLLDGEGHIGIHKSKNGFRKGVPRELKYSARLMIANTNIDIMHWLQLNFGGSIAKDVRDGNRKDCYRWQIYGNKMLEFLKLVAPYLKIKSSQAKIVIDWQSKIIYGAQPKMTDKQKQKRESAYLQILELNRRGKILGADGGPRSHNSLT